MRAARAHGVTRRTDASREVGATVSRIARADALPGPGDQRAMIPPVSSALTRRVPGRNLWIWFTATETHVYLVGLSAVPPPLIDG